ncbi:MAG: class II glutamine amidotransferase, partial [Vicinamibacterales bacterium]|nr:class II glutamine amidotransferase [Vicinamibacterales bacterium]
MCGIVGYVGKRPAAPLLIEGLKRLEYRGYDSAGLAVIADDGLHIGRSVGRVSVLEAQLAADHPIGGTTGVAHTRWATHGAPTEPNAHPHVGQTRSGHTVALVHNGIIENFATIRTYLTERGHEFTSQTDTEVLTKLIAELYEGRLETAVQSALQQVTGAYAIAVVCDAEPSTLICARKGSPLIIGVADSGYVVASDASAIIAHTTQVVTLEDYQVAALHAGHGRGDG